MKLIYAMLCFMLICTVALSADNASGNATNQTGNKTDDGIDYVKEGQGILDGMYQNYKGIFGTFTKATGIEAEAVSAMLAISLILVLLGKRARKYLFYALIIFLVLWIIGWV